MVAKVVSRCASKLGGASAGITYVRVPLCFGVSPAPAGKASASRAASPAANRSCRPIFSSRSLSPLFIQPDPAQILVQIETGADLEPLEIGAVRHDAVLPQH